MLESPPNGPDIFDVFWLPRRGGVLESPPNGPDIFDVFRLPRHLSNFPYLIFYGDSEKCN